MESSELNEVGRLEWRWWFLYFSHYTADDGTVCHHVIQLWINAVQNTMSYAVRRNDEYMLNICEGVIRRDAQLLLRTAT